MLELTGETNTITIPSDIKMSSGARNGGLEVSISSLKTGDMLQEWLKDGAVSQVRVIQNP